MYPHIIVSSVLTNVLFYLVLSGYGIVCDFEHLNLCGYTNLTLPKTYWDDRDIVRMTQTLWEHTASLSITRPSSDHTYQSSGQGTYLAKCDSRSVPMIYVLPIVCCICCVFVLLFVINVLYINMQS